MSAVEAAHPPDAAHCIAIGTERLLQGDLDDAACWYRQALTLEPMNPSALANLGECLRRLGRLHQAELTLVQGLCHHRTSPDLLHNLAVVLESKREFAAAERLCQRLLDLSPGHEGACNTLATIAFNQGRFAAAEEWWRRALGGNPANQFTYCNLGMALWRQGRAEQAEGFFLTAARLAPDLANAMAALGWICRQAGRLEEAIQWFERVLVQAPGAIDIQTALGDTYLQMGRIDAARIVAEAIAALGHPCGYALLGDVLREVKDFAGAVTQYRNALAAGGDASPGAAGVYNALGHALIEEGDAEAAATHFRAAIAADPEHAEAHSNLGQTLLLLGRIEEGFREYDWRWRVPAWPAKRLPYPLPLWQGEPLAGRTILLEVEQGLGDTLQFIRYAKLVKALGARVVVPFEPALERLFRRVPGIDAVLPRPVDCRGIDYVANVIDLAVRFGTTNASIPAEIPYLFVEPELVARWGARIGMGKELAVGLVWGGNVTFIDDGRRSPRLPACLPLLETPGVRFVGLQMGGARADLEGRTMPASFLDLGGELGDLADSAAVIANLDLVITSDTAIAHLAGGLGLPVWVLLKAMPDWRWRWEGKDCTWYPSMRLFRQKTAGDWNAVVADARESLLRAAIAKAKLRSPADFRQLLVRGEA